MVYTHVVAVYSSGIHGLTGKIIDCPGCYCATLYYYTAEPLLAIYTFSEYFGLNLPPLARSSI
jgi:hypothetical protein